MYENNCDHVDILTIVNNVKINEYICVNNKKVLLHERKRHIACRVVSTLSVVLTVYSPHLGTPQQGTPPSWPRRYPAKRGVPYLGTSHPDLAGGYPDRVPLAGSPLAGYPPCPDLARGYLPPGRVPPSRVCPTLTWLGTPPRCLPHGILGNVAKHYGIWVPPPSWTWPRYPPPQVSAPWHSE